MVDTGHFLREARVDTCSQLQPSNPLFLHWAHHLPNPHLSISSEDESPPSSPHLIPWQQRLPFFFGYEILWEKMDHMQAKFGVQTNVRTLKREMITLWENPVSASSNQEVTDICAHHLLKTFHQKPSPTEQEQPAEPQEGFCGLQVYKDRREGREKGE